MSRPKRDRGEWEELVCGFEASELSTKEFATRHGVSASTLAWWRWRLRRERAEAQAPGRALVPFVRVEVSSDDGEVAGAVTPQPVGPTLEVPGGLVLRFPVEANADYVAAVLAGATRAPAPRSGNMLSLPPSVEVYLASEPADMRKGIDGLAGIVRTQWRRDVFSGHLFVFHGRRRHLLKILFFDRGGFVLYVKRLECRVPAK